MQSAPFFTRDRKPDYSENVNNRPILDDCADQGNQIV